MCAFASSAYAESLSMCEFNMLARCAAAGNLARGAQSGRYRFGGPEPTYNREFLVPWHGRGMIQP